MTPVAWYGFWGHIRTMVFEKNTNISVSWNWLTIVLVTNEISEFFFRMFPFFPNIRKKFHEKKIFRHTFFVWPKICFTQKFLRRFWIFFQIFFCSAKDFFVRYWHSFRTGDVARREQGGATAPLNFLSSPKIQLNVIFNKFSCISCLNPLFCHPKNISCPPKDLEKNAVCQPIASWSKITLRKTSSPRCEDLFLFFFWSSSKFWEKYRSHIPFRNHLGSHFPQKILVAPSNISFWLRACFVWTVLSSRKKTENGSKYPWISPNLRINSQMLWTIRKIFRRYFVGNYTWFAGCWQVIACLIMALLHEFMNYLD